MATAKKSPIQTAVDLLKKNGYTVTKKRADPRIGDVVKWNALVTLVSEIAIHQGTYERSPQSAIQDILNALDKLRAPTATNGQRTTASTK